MVHYMVRVPSDGEASTDWEMVITRLKSFNDSKSYLLFDSGDDKESRFILVSEVELSKKAMTRLKNIFEKDVTTEKINIDGIDRSLSEKIRVAKELMEDQDNYYGKKTPMFITESCSQLLEKGKTQIGSTEFEEFLGNYIDFIDRTSNVKANALYNVAFINNSGMCLDNHIEVLYGILAAKGLLVEQAMIRGTKYDARHTDSETRFVYVIEDEWVADDDEDSLSPDERLLIAIFGREKCTISSSGDSLIAKLLMKIKGCANIYITSMKQDEYDRISKDDRFAVAFPNVVTLSELSMDERIKAVCSIAGEYGFAVDRGGFAEDTVIGAAAIDDIEMAVRKAVLQKLTDTDNGFVIGLSDLDVKVAKSEKVSPIDELENLIGLGGVKKTINEIVSLLRKRGKNAVPCLHMAFLGNPGTGKTTVARIIARLFAEVGLTKKDLLVETQRGGLIGEYLGETAPKTAKVINSALGGVLFIDEAYALIERDDDLYGKEALATLVKIMEDKREEFVCILAGYTEEMNEMLDFNPGLRDRIQFYIDFPDYNCSELMQIFENFCKDNEYDLEESARAALRAGFTRILSTKSQNFSNGRLVRKIFERVRIKQAWRTSDNTITESDILDTLSESDIAALFSNNRIKIGFKLSA